MKSSLKQLPLTVLKMSSLTAILRQVPASLQEPKWLQRVLLSGILLVKQSLLTLHLLNVASQPAEATATQPANETDKKVETDSI